MTQQLTLLPVRTNKIHLSEKVLLVAFTLMTVCADYGSGQRISLLRQRAAAAAAAAVALSAGPR